MHITLTSRGRIVIPSKIRKLLGITEGTRIHVSVDENRRRIILTPITREFIHNVRGNLKGTGILRALIVGKASEREV